MKSTGQANLKYETPETVAQVLARHVPRCAATVLDPCVGRGRLLMPVMRRIGSRLNRAVCVDISSVALESFLSGLRDDVRGRTTAIHGDFLRPQGNQHALSESGLFDCVVMNPPFSARREGFVPLSAPDNGRLVPVEVAFVARSIQLLKPGGRLLAVLPPSIVSASSTRWFREHMLAEGAILCVHELPGFTFKGVESRIYVFVFERAGKSGSIVLLNHDLRSPHKVSARVSGCGPDYRLDFHFHQCRADHEQVVRRAPHLLWCKVGEIADVLRGKVNWPRAGVGVLHTSHYRDGVWEYPGRASARGRMMGQVTVRKGDIVVKRVGRGCASSFGAFHGGAHAVCTDCVLVIRPRAKVSRWELLLALRVVADSKWGRGLLEQGTGATYISARTLHDLPIPAGLRAVFPRLFAKYQRAAEGLRLSQMVGIESEIRAHLERRAGSIGMAE